MSYLRHKKTGEVYPLHDTLLRSGDYDSFDTLEEAQAGAGIEPELKPAEVPKEAKAPKVPRAKKEKVVEAEAPAEAAVEVTADLNDELDDLLGD